MHDIFVGVLPALTDIAIVLLTGLLASIGTWMNRKLKLDIDLLHRDALHSAIRTGVQKTLETVANSPELAKADAKIDEVINYVNGSVPDALKHFQPTRKQLQDMVIAKINEAADPLTVALREAGAPVK